MIGLYCHDHHGSKRGRPCDRCSSLLSYAERRLDRCPFHEDKPACNHCQVHCYKRDKRERVRQVMRYSGPRMLLRHPVLSLLHLLDEKRSARNMRDVEVSSSKGRPTSRRHGLLSE